MREGSPVTSGNASSFHSPSSVLLGSSVERRDNRWPRRDKPGILMMAVLERRSVESDSVEEVEPAVLHLVTLRDVNSWQGRRTAGMYMG